MGEKAPQEIQSMYRVRKDQLRSEVRTTKKVKLKDGSTAYETSVMKVGAGKNPTIMLSPFKKQLENVDKVAIQQNPSNPSEIIIRKLERGRGRPKS